MHKNTTLKQHAFAIKPAAAAFAGGRKLINKQMHDTQQLNEEEKNSQEQLNIMVGVVEERTGEADLVIDVHNAVNENKKSQVNFKIIQHRKNQQRQTHR